MSEERPVFLYNASLVDSLQAAPGYYMAKLIIKLILAVAKGTEINYFPILNFILENVL